ncbi:siderophore-interacting protein [Leucobacter sp. NPDC058333]|uniref:siderophore-interacting protein n=1 Tax=Leucobacter sp. NPDC058333 TaxID=3346450 RepID=UPI00364E8458
MTASNIAVVHAESGLITAEVVVASRISPSFVRLTVAGDDLSRWRHLGFDQWFRLAIPVAGDSTRFDRMADRFDTRGYLRYLTLPKATRPEIRNYTVREFRPDLHELDIDFVMHESEDPAHAGVAAPWAASMPVGARVALIDQGCGYRAVADADQVVLAGDESALPAVIGILRDLPRSARGHAVIEIPQDEDRQPIDAPAGVDVQWIVREHGARPGAAALHALRELPEAATSGPVSAFVAGEQQLATGGRRLLVNDRGVAKHAVDFCGYWRER